MIHKAIITAALLAVSFTASAQTAERVHMCQQLEGLAKSIMEARQLGIPMSESYAVASRSGDADVRAIAQAMVRDAYKSSIYQTDKYRQQEINEFGSAMFLACIGDK